MLKDELVFDRLAGFSLRTKYESLKKDTAEVEAHVRQLIECLESLTRLQQRYNCRRLRSPFRHHFLPTLVDHYVFLYNSRLCRHVCRARMHVISNPF